MSLKSLAWGALLALHAVFTDAITVSSTVLILAQDDATAASGSSGLRGYGIPYETLIVPQEGVELPDLTSSGDAGNYGGFIVLNEVGYDYDDGWRTALTSEQWEAIYNYQTSFSVRLVRLNVFPSEEFGVTTAHPRGLGCCDDGVTQDISFTDVTGFSTANLKENVGLSTEGLWHYPARITNTTIATKVAEFGSGGIFEEPSVAAVINEINGREQMVFFMAWATEWAMVSNYLQHAYIHWMTRGLFLGQRRIYLSAQIDDIHLDTPMYYPTNDIFRISTDDLDAHKAWQEDINSRLPRGSDFFLEMCHNGNGDIIEATDTEYGWEICDPSDAVDYDSPPDPPLEFMKPPGTGSDIWPEWFSTYPWTLQCAEIDDVASWFMVEGNRDAFAHVSHTFTHMGLNNATYNDTWREIAFNRDWLVQVGISEATMFSPFGLVPPAITGLHNADAIQAWLDNGILYVVGDNTRPLLRNPENDFWPRITTVEDNGTPGLVIIPRWATNIYFNCDVAECTVKEWIDTSGVGEESTFEELMVNEITTNVRYLLGLHHDPYMFHQANLRQTDVDSIQVGTETGEFSLVQIWVEAITQELTRLTNWPVRSLKHDDIASLFLDRMTRDKCEPKLSYSLSDDATTITGMTVTANDNACDVPIAITFPGTGTLHTESSDVTVDKVGDEPLVIWVKLSGEAASFTFDQAVSL